MSAESFSTPDYGYHSANATYHDAYIADPILRLCRQFEARRVVDIGCGNGTFARRLAAAGFEVVGCDPSSSGVRLAQAAAPRVTFKQVGVNDDPATLGQEGFDVAVSLEVVEHLYMPRALPAFAKAVLKPGGHLIVSTPYHGFLKNLALSVTNGWDEHWAPLWDGGHIKFWSPHTLRRLGEAEGFIAERTVMAGRCPWLWKSMIMVFRAP